MASGTKNRKWLGYTLYVVVVALALLYYLFPAEAVEKAFDSGIKRVSPALGFKAGKTGLGVPAGIRMDNALLYLEKKGGIPVFEAASLYVGPRLLEAVRGRYSFDLAGKAYGGDITGSFDRTGADGTEPGGELSLRDLDIAGYAFLAEIMQHRLTGRLSGNIAYNTDANRRKSSSGKASLRLTGGLLQFQNPVFDIASLDLQAINMELELRKGEITVIRAELAGPEVKASLNGSIQLHQDVAFSQLNLKGTLEPLAEFYKNYPAIRELLQTMKKRMKRGQYFFTITGTLGEPRFRLL